MKTLQDIKMDNEAIIYFTSTRDSYNEFELLIDANLCTDLDKADISAILEYTLHRMLESDFTPNDIYYNSGFEDELLPECEEFEEYITIDLGYYLNGLIIDIYSKSQL